MINAAEIDIAGALAGFVAVTTDTTGREGAVDVGVVKDVFGNDAIRNGAGDAGADVVQLLGAGLGVAILGDAGAEIGGTGVGTGRLEGAR